MSSLLDARIDRIPSRARNAYAEQCAALPSDVPIPEPTASERILRELMAAEDKAEELRQQIRGKVDQILGCRPSEGEPSGPITPGGVSVSPIFPALEARLGRLNLTLERCLEEQGRLREVV